VKQPIFVLLAYVRLALLVLLNVTAGSAWSQAPVDATHREMLPVVALGQLPPQVRETTLLIRRGGPFPYSRDGVAFGNRERILPQRGRGYYREYTVPTPGLSHRGARRIVVGLQDELYYTDDHYRTFRRIRE
jgi:guanyl-specific ribonuclease Sa